MYIFMVDLLGLIIGIFTILFVPVFIIIAIISAIQEDERETNKKNTPAYRTNFNSEGYAYAISDYKLVVINMRGKVIYNTEYELKYFSEDFVKQCERYGYFILKDNNKEEYLYDRFLKKINLPFDFFEFQNDDYILVGDKSLSKQGILNRWLNVVIPVEHKKCRYVRDNKFFTYSAGIAEIRQLTPYGKVKTITRIKGNIRRRVYLQERILYEIFLTDIQQTALFNDELKLLINNCEVISDRSELVTDGRENFFVKINGRDAVVNLNKGIITPI